MNPLIKILAFLLFTVTSFQHTYAENIARNLESLSETEYNQLPKGSSVVIGLTVYNIGEDFQERHNMLGTAIGFDVNLSNNFWLIRYGAGIGLLSTLQNDSNSDENTNSENQQEEDEYTWSGVDLQIEAGPSFNLYNRLTMDVMWGYQKIFVGQSREECDTCVNNSSFGLPAQTYIKYRLGYFNKGSLPGLSLELTQSLQAEPDRRYHRFGISGVYRVF